MIRICLILLTVLPVSVFTDDRVYEKIESRVFSGRDLAYVKSLYTSNTVTGPFQNALVDYRLGNMTTNVDLLRKGMTLLSNMLRDTTNVFTVTYYGLMYSSIAFLTPDLFEKLPALGQSFAVLDRAVEMYPGHYLPHFYRSMLKLMAPSFVGGNEETGVKDMEFVLSNMGSIRRDNDYKSFIHFFYAVYWGEKRNELDRAGSMLSNAYRLAESVEMKTNIEKYMKKYGERRGKS